MLILISETSGAELSSLHDNNINPRQAMLKSFFMLWIKPKYFCYKMPMKLSANFAT
jgi:hypothetical protein